MFVHIEDSNYRLLHRATNTEFLILKIESQFVLIIVTRRFQPSIKQFLMYFVSIT